MMRNLRFVGVAEDGRHLLVRATGDGEESGEQFLLPIDDRLQAAARGDRSRLGQIEIELESSLRPREIQARIRGGESVEEVAAAAGVSVERVMRFAHPVIAERDQVCIEARRTRIRRGESAPRLGAQVDDRLLRRGVDPARSDWDAYRRDDGSWWLTLSWPQKVSGRTARQTVRAQWSFDLGARTLTPADDLAAELQAEEPRRRSVASVPFVPEDTDPPAADAAEHVGTQAAPAVAGDDSDERPAGRRRGRLRSRRRHPESAPDPDEQHRPAAPEDPGAAPADVGAAPAEAGSARAEQPTGQSAPVGPVRPAQEPPVPERLAPGETPADQPGATKRGRRPSVPSWDDILFGTRGHR